MLDRPCIVFGAFDRHNFGDLLFAHLADALLPGRHLVHAGLAARDLRADGGHLTRALAEVAATYRGQEVDLLHAGGEVLACSAWQAGAMLLPPQEAARTIAHLESHPLHRQAYLERVLGVSARAPYTAGRDLFPRARAVVYNGVGGVALAHDDALRAEVLARLAAADFVGVRDGLTLATLAQAGIAARLMPDPAVLLRELFGPLLQERADVGECAANRACFPAGYLAVQCSADFGDDSTLDVLAAQLAALAGGTGLGAALFVAGAAPWHDDAHLYARLQQRLAHCRARIFGSLDVFDICALIAGSAGYAGSSLHGRIAAMACGLPRINLRRAGDGDGKAAAFASTWDPRLPGAVEPAHMAEAMAQALALPPQALREAGEQAAASYRAAFDAIRSLLS